MSAPPAAPTRGVVLPIATLTGAARCAQVARDAEALGLDAVWVADDLAGPGVDAPACLAAAAAVTDRLQLGFGLAPAADAVRAPAWTAKHLTAIDALAPGRLRLATGLRAAAEDPASLLELLLGGRVPGVDPALAPPVVSPALTAPPPLTVAGDGDAARRLAARLAHTWLAPNLSPARTAEAATEIAEIAAEHDRPPPATALLIDDTRPDRIVGAVQRLDEYTAVGVDAFLLVSDDDGALETFAVAGGRPAP